MAKRNVQQIARAVSSLAEGRNKKEIETLAKDTVAFLAKNKMITHANELLVQIEKEENKKEGILVAEITVKEKLSKSTKDNISNILEKQYKGNKIEIREKLDDKIIGGIKIKIEDTVIDNTIIGRMRDLQKILTQ
jgi:F-type H+-transporting ATPase subunit delta